MAKVNFYNNKIDCEGAKERVAEAPSQNMCANVSSEDMVSPALRNSDAGKMSTSGTNKKCISNISTIKNLKIINDFKDIDSEVSRKLRNIIMGKSTKRPKPMSTVPKRIVLSDSIDNLSISNPTETSTPSNSRASTISSQDKNNCDVKMLVNTKKPSYDDISLIINNLNQEIENLYKKLNKEMQLRSTIDLNKMKKHTYILRNKFESINMDCEEERRTTEPPWEIPIGINNED